MYRAWEYIFMSIIFSMILLLYLKWYPKMYKAPVLFSNIREEKILKNITTKEKPLKKDEYNVISEARSSIDKAYTFYKMYRAYEEHGIESFEKGGVPMKIMLVSTWRAGSSFLSGIIQSVAPNFNSFEAYPKLFTKRVKTVQDSKSALDTIHKMLNCEYSTVQNYSKFARNHKDFFKQHTLMNYCDEDLCFDNKFVSSLCRLFPFQTFRVMRFDLGLIRDYFMNTSSNVHIIYLARDPRAIMSSRIFVRNCQLSPECMNPKILCDDMLRDYIAAREFHEMYPHNFTVLRFEDLLKTLSKEVPNLLRSIKMILSPEVVSFLNKHTREDDFNTYSTQRTSRTVPYKWKNILTYEYVKEVQRVCAPTLAVWGYSLITSERQLERKTRPLILPYDPFGDPTTEAE